MEKVNLIIFARRPEISIGKRRLKNRIGKALGANFYHRNLLRTILKIQLYQAPLEKFFPLFKAGKTCTVLYKKALFKLIYKLLFKEHLLWVNF